MALMARLARIGLMALIARIVWIGSDYSIGPITLMALMARLARIGLITLIGSMALITL